jgi:hypothetical protein
MALRVIVAVAVVVVDERNALALILEGRIAKPPPAALLAVSWRVALH